MTAAPDKDSTSLLLTSANAMLAALTGAIDDLNRAVLILRQESRTASERFRTPEDLQCIASQISDRVRSCGASHETTLALCASIARARQP
jgi:hypothetical protein